MPSKFDPSEPDSVEVATLLKLADLIAACTPFSQLCEKDVGADAREKVLTGPFPLAWETSKYTKDQLATLLCTVNIHPPMQSDKSVVLDSGSFIEPRESGSFFMTIRRYVRESEWEYDKTGNDIYMFFLSRISKLETEMVRLSDLAATNTNNYPHPITVQRAEGPAFGQLKEKVAQGEYLWARYIIGWGLSEDS